MSNRRKDRHDRPRISRIPRISRLSASHPSFDQFVATIAALRAPDGCPWDRVQTHESIAHNMIEEAYEAVGRHRDRATPRTVREELGDVPLQVVLQLQIAADDGEFTIDDVCAEVNEKMIRRHPHVFGDAHAANASETLDLWDKVKLAEKGSADEAADDAGAPREGLLDGVPTSFPALMQAQKISRKAAAAGFEWDSLDDVWDKVREEVGELREAYEAAPKAANGKADADAAPATGDPASAEARGGRRRRGRVRRRAVLARERGPPHGRGRRGRPALHVPEVPRPLGVQEALPVSRGRAIEDLAPTTAKRCGTSQTTKRA